MECAFYCLIVEGRNDQYPTAARHGTLIDFKSTGACSLCPAFDGPPTSASNSNPKLSIYLSICLSVYLSIYLSISLSAFYSSKGCSGHDDISRLTWRHCWRVSQHPERCRLLPLILPLLVFASAGWLSSSTVPGPNSGLTFTCLGVDWQFLESEKGKGLEDGPASSWKGKDSFHVGMRYPSISGQRAERIPQDHPCQKS